MFNQFLVASSFGSIRFHELSRVERTLPCHRVLPFSRAFLTLLSDRAINAAQFAVFSFAAITFAYEASRKIFAQEAIREFQLEQATLTGAFVTAIALLTTATVAVQI